MGLTEGTFESLDVHLGPRHLTQVCDPALQFFLESFQLKTRHLKQNVYFICYWTDMLYGLNGFSRTRSGSGPSIFLQSLPYLQSLSYPEYYLQPSGSKKSCRNSRENSYYNLLSQSIPQQLLPKGDTH